MRTPSRRMETARRTMVSLVLFFNDPPTTEIYTLSLHDALPIWGFNGSSFILRFHLRSRFILGQVEFVHDFLLTQDQRREFVRIFKWRFHLGLSVGQPRTARKNGV